MSITSKGRTNFAKSMIDDGRTTYRRQQANRSLDMQHAINVIKSRPEPLYKEGDALLLADGTLRNIIAKTFSNSQKTWQYRITTKQPNRWGGTVASPLYTEQEIINMTSPIAKPKFNKGDLLLLPTGFWRKVKSVVLNETEPKYWFYIEGKQLVSYTEEQLSKPASIEAKIDELPSFYDDPNPRKHIIGVHMPVLPFYPETIKSLVYTQPDLLAEKDARIAELEQELRKANKKVELIQHKEIQCANLRKNQNALLRTVREIAPEKVTAIAESLLETIEYDKMVGPIMMRNLEMVGEVTELERQNTRLKTVLDDIREAAEKRRGDDIDSLWGWISFIASMGINGGYYSENLLNKFNKPQTLDCEKETL